MIKCPNCNKEYIITSKKKILRESRAMLFPGFGFFINEWLYKYANNLKSARKALERNDLFASIIKTVFHEKLGHGFIYFKTALVGKEFRSSALYRIYLGSKFHDKLFDAPEYNLIEAKMQNFHETSLFTHEGLAIWLENYLSFKLADQYPVMVGLSESYTLDALKSICSHISIQRKRKYF